jgi:hypothetical protein
MNTTHSTKKKLLAQALGIAAAAVLGVLANGGTAAADGHGINDKTATWKCPVTVSGSATAAGKSGGCSSSGGAEGAQDVGEQRGADDVPAVEAHDTGSYPAAPSYPAGSGAYNVHASLPTASYPAGSSWPDNAWGVNDRASS